MGNFVPDEPKTFMTRVELECSKVWINNHPELFGKTVSKFFNDHPSPDWKIKAIEYPTDHYVTFVATRDDSTNQLKRIVGELDI